MSDIAIQVHQLGKRYRIGQGARPSYNTLRDQLAQTVLRPYHRLRSGIGQNRDRHRVQVDDKYIWALRDVSFDVKQGEIVGIIGVNGAGKSTLLKLLTQITEPTAGSIDLFGRVGSLLEVGTGFHKELTGRENIYLNGAILGMRKSEIDRKFDEIVAFSEIEKFIDTPVKYYSSGMYVRLAFAVAAHLQPEILLVDEVLAVGDAAFQRKCLNKMEDVGKQGRTILFVSHHMPSITRLCGRVVLLNEGQIMRDGPAHQVVGDYLQITLSTTPAQEWPDLESAPGNDVARLRAIRVKTEDGKVASGFDVRKPVLIEMEFDVLQPGHILYPHFTAYNDEGVWLFSSVDTDPEWRSCPRPPGRYISTAIIPGNLLNEGTVSIGPAIRTEEPIRLHFYERDAIAFQIIESPDGDSARVDEAGKVMGAVRPYLKWNTHYFKRGN